MARPHIMHSLGKVSLNKIYLSSGGVLLSVEMFRYVWTDTRSSQYLGQTPGPLNTLDRV